MPEMSPDIGKYIPVASIAALSCGMVFKLWKVMKEPKTKRQYTLFYYLASRLASSPGRHTA